MGFRLSECGNNSLYDRMNNLLESKEWSDCSFLVDGKSFRAHKLILGVSSPVFKAMFYGPLSNNEDVTVTDVDPNIFDIVLKFIYTDKVNVNSIEDAFDLMYVARKYMLENLIDICANYLSNNITIDNVITILNYPDHLQDKHVEEGAIDLFCQHADYMLTENKQNITSECMKKIVKSLEMNITERDLIKHVFEWTENYCDQNNIPNTLKNRREALEKNGVFKYLRFYSLSSKDVDDIASSEHNLLLSYEIEDIKKFDKNALNLDHKLLSLLDKQLLPRQPAKVPWSVVHRTPVRSMPPLVIDQNNLIKEVSVITTASMFVSSLNVPSRMSPVIELFTPIPNTYSEQFTITISNLHNKTVVKTMLFKENVEYNSHIDITFDKAILLKEKCLYKISFEWPNTYYPLSYAVQARDYFYKAGRIKIKFNDSYRLSCEGGSFLKGLKYSL